MDTPILNKFFDNWARSVFGPDYRTKMPAVQLSETEKAFMSGFASYYFFTMEATAMTDAGMVAQLAAVNDEIQRYFAAFKRMPRDPNSN